MFIENIGCNVRFKANKWWRKRNLGWNSKMHQFWCISNCHLEYGCFNFLGVEANYISLHVSVQSLLKPLIILKFLMWMQTMWLSCPIIILCINKFGEMGGQKAWRGGRSNSLERWVWMEPIYIERQKQSNKGESTKKKRWKWNSICL